MSDNFVLTRTLPQLGCTREDIYSLLRSMVPGGSLVNEGALGVSDGSVYLKSGVPRWSRFDVAYTDYTVSGLSESVTVLPLPAGAVIYQTALRVSDRWLIGGMSSLQLSLGVTGDLDRFSNASYLNGAVEGWAFYDAPAHGGMVDLTDNSELLLTAVSDAGALNTATAGSAIVYVLHGGAVSV